VVGGWLVRSDEGLWREVWRQAWASLQDLQPHPQLELSLALELGL